MPRCLFVACCLLGALALAGCKETGPRVYTACLYHPNDQGGCLDAYTPIGLVEAHALGASCDAVCLLEDKSLYVSTVCAPYPSTAELILPEESPDCATALALLAALASGDEAAIKAATCE